MTAKLKISADLSLPIEFLTSTQAIVAKKRVGKTYTAMVEAEELLEAGQQVVVLDPTGAWWGLRSSADGKSAGYVITIFGGDHGDVPLEATAGEVIAQAIVTERFSCVLDLTLLRKAERLRFIADFLETLYRLNREAMHLFIDEADVAAPQKAFTPEQARALGACDELVRRGGIRGIGVTLITQRSQVLNKDVLSQIDTLVVMRMNHPKDIGAIRDWIIEYVDAKTAKEMIASLPSLPKAMAWFWSPLTEQFQKIKIREKRTFDSGKTPEAGVRQVMPKKMAEIDIQRLGEMIASTVERVKQNDPKALKLRIAELERQVAKPAPAAKVETRTIEKPILEAKVAEKLGKVIDHAQVKVAELYDRLGTVMSELMAVKKALFVAEAWTKAPPSSPARTPRLSHYIAPPRSKSADASPAAAGGELAGGERKILTALAQYPGGRSKQQVAILTGYAHNGGGFSNYVSALRTKGYLEGDSARLVITRLGAETLGGFEPLPTGKALFDFWQGQLGKAEREVLRVLFDDWPEARPKEYVAVKAGYSANGGGFNNALSRLRTLELIEGKAKLRASDQLVGAEL